MGSGRSEARAFDVIVVGGGPAGSVCARTLSDGGLRVGLLDRQRFPRVKLCAGWVSAPIWDVIEVPPEAYPRGLWPWQRCHVHYDGVDQTVVASGHFIRRAEFDEFLLRRCGATVIEGHMVRHLERSSDGGWLVDGRYHARYLVGAGGTSCPVARCQFPARPDQAVGVQEIELEVDQREVAKTRLGRDGEPELLLHRDLSGYSWNVPKTGWLNLGCGTDQPREVRQAWTAARAHFEARGHVPSSARASLDRPKGHTYYLFDPIRFGSCCHDGVFLVGDALGLAHPLTAEGILPAALSGKICAQAILAGDPTSYPRRLAEQPLMRDYALVYRLRQLARSLRRGGAAGGGAGWPVPSFVTTTSRRAIASGFAWMFGGKPVPARRAIDGLAGAVERAVQSPVVRALTARSTPPGGTR